MNNENFFPSLPLLNKINGAAFYNEACVLVAFQHLLPTVGSLFEKLISNGWVASDIFVLGKCYSTVEPVYNSMKKLGIHVFKGTTPKQHGYYQETIEKDAADIWHHAEQRILNNNIKKVIILDENNTLYKTIPQSLKNTCKLIAIEQTRRKTPYSSELFPIISVANSWVKKNLETFFIGYSITQSLIKSLKKNNITSQRVLIVGAGGIGRSCEKFLASKNYETVVFSGKNKDLLKILIKNSDIILGCTGVDLFKGINNFDFLEQKVLVSGSVGDIEFSSYLKTISNPKQNEFADIKINNTTVINSGYPINFDRKKEQEKISDIQLTRAIVMAGIMQAFKHNQQFLEVNTDIENQVKHDWLKMNNQDNIFEQVA